jgi:hypothetical protein
MKEGKYIWRVLRRHVEAGHTLRIRLEDPDDVDLILECVWCGREIAAGPPAVVNYIGERLKEAGVTVVRPATQPQVRIQ